LRLAFPDLQDIEAIAINASLAGRRAAVTFKRPPRRQSEGDPVAAVVSLNVAGPNRQWADEATDALLQRIEAGVPRSVGMFKWVLRVCLAIVGIGVVLVIVGSRGDVRWLTRVGVVGLGVGFGVLLLWALTESFLPRLEVLPAGEQTRRSKLLRWGRREVAWLARNVFLILVGIGLTLLGQRLI
jgi:hypothetical protein